MDGYFYNFFDDYKKQKDVKDFLDEWAKNHRWDEEFLIKFLMVDTKFTFDSEYPGRYTFGIINERHDGSHQNEINFYFHVILNAEQPIRDDVPYCGNKVYVEVTGTLERKQSSFDIKEYCVEDADSDFNLGEGFVFDYRPYKFLNRDFIVQKFKDEKLLLDYLMSISSLSTRLFRGHGDASWQLYPLATRDPNCFGRGTIEKRSELLEMRRILLKKELMFLEPSRYRAMGDKEWLFFLQHHRVPTYLLDFSSSIWVALYFAVCDSKDKDKDACIWVINSSRENIKVNAPKLELKRVDPPYYDLQMRFQKSNFVEFSFAPNVKLSDLEECYQTIESKIVSSWNTQKIIIDKELKKGLYNYLSKIGLKKSDLFPTISNIVEDTLQQLAERSNG